MIQKIAFIGVTGNLAPFVYKELIKQGIIIKALVRNLDKVKKIPNFPKEIQIIQGDLSNLDDLRELFSDTDAVYLNLSTSNSEALFQPEIDGIKNVIKVAKEKDINRIFHVSAVTAAYPEFAQGAELFINDIRKVGYHLLKESNIPCTFFHCSWIMDTIEFSMRKGNTLQGFKSIRYPIFWLAGKDLGKMIMNAVKQSDHSLTKDYIMQGKEAITFKEALKRYSSTYSPNLKVQLAPIWLLKTIGLFNKEARLAAQMASFFSNYKEEFKAKQTWKELGEPIHNIENFMHS
ncbi:SDR family oxidoreductase [Aureispira anguillae]|uniref:NAD(P)H-binding protein n=1 Tax=Aureispira anguillae TaxID=2864201 RepID=A0A915YIR6_9BACT|nr:NAD(P)H-binding protein [Aureispira anguillae]BDS13759.1 NAD(P)H-binding protein [Aureispira anguillae]